MAKYVDGFLLSVPKKKLAAYKKMASEAGRVWKKHGALHYFECTGDELNLPWSTHKFTAAAKAKPGEIVVFSFIVYKSKNDRNRVNKKVMNDPFMDKYRDKPMPFDMKRMACGGFKALVEQ